jgi:hypothetical protein
MEIFSYIFLKINKLTDNIVLEDFLDNIDSYHNNTLILHIYNFVSAIIFHKKQNYNTETDYRINYFDYYILQNNKINEGDKNYLFDIFSKTQKIYNSLNRNCFLYKKYKAKHYDVNCDFYMSNFNTLKSNILFSIFCKKDKTIYKFRISDIITIINNALTYEQNFISTPQQIKNPYTNIPFDKGELYYIYFKIKESTLLMPHLFHQLFIVNFDLEQFRLYNECYIREKSIINFIKSDNIIEKYKYILSMIADYFIYANISIDFFFPPNILVNHFNKPYLELYLKSLYSLNPDLKFNSSIILTQKLIRFHRLNPNYAQPFVTKKRDNENNIHLIYRYNTTINIESSNLIDNLLQNNNENHEENEEELEDLQEDEDAEEGEQDEEEDEYNEGEGEEEDNEDIEHQQEESYQYFPIIEFNIQELYGNTISN